MDGKAVIKFIRDHQKDLEVTVQGTQMRITLKVVPHLTFEERTRLEKIREEFHLIYQTMEQHLGTAWQSSRYVARSRTWNSLPHLVSKTVKESKKEELQVLEKLNEKREKEFDRLKEEIGIYTRNVEDLCFKPLDLTPDCYDYVIEWPASYVILVLDTEDEHYYPELKEAGLMK